MTIHSPLHPDPTVLETRLGSRLAAALTEQSTQLPHDVTERLRFARETALARAREARAQTAPVAAAAPASVVLGGVPGAALFGSTPWWQRWASVVPLAMLVFGLLLIEQWTAHEQVLAAADIDAVLLSDDLPPAAYTDPGFVEFMKAPPQ